MRFIIEGGVPLRGTVDISGAKNAAIKMIAAALLTDEEIVLENVPRIGDVENMIEIAQSLGVEVSWLEENKLWLKAEKITTTDVPPKLSHCSRCAVLTLGPLLSRFGKASISEPGGCLIGERPINRHIEALEALGAKISYEKGLYKGEAEKLLGATIRFEKNTVMGTENALLAASLAEGETTILNAACEPEVDDLIELLKKMGVEIKREEDDPRTILVEGVPRLKGATHKIIPDRNEVVTFAIAAAATRGDVEIRKMRPSDITAFLAKLEAVGVSFEVFPESLRVWVEEGKTLKAVDIETRPHPGFMTDWQQPLSVLLTQSGGESTIHDTVYVNRFEYTKGLNRMGAKIKTMTPLEAGLPVVISDDSYNLKKEGEPTTVAKIEGPTQLRGTRLEIPDLRAGATLVLAALVASGKSEIFGIEHIDRGYEKFDGKFKNLGARIERVE